MPGAKTFGAVINARKNQPRDNERLVFNRGKIGGKISPMSCSSSSFVRRTLALSLLIQALSTAVRGEERESPPCDAPHPRAVAAAKLALASAAEYRRQKDCFSCHHQALPLWTAAAVAARGEKMDAEEIAEIDRMSAA
jgi:hypothetical protein